MGRTTEPAAALLALPLAALSPRRSPAPAAAAAAARLLEGAAHPNDPWEGTMGTFCAAWGGGMNGEWCFVSPTQQCNPDPGKVLFTSSQGADLTRSTGPCTDAVDARSQYVLDGMDKMLEVLHCTVILGLCLTVTTVCGYLLYFFPSAETPKKGARMPDYKEEPPLPQKVASDWYTLEQRFEEAQKQAVRKLKDQTPADIKFMLYGFYKQAQEGDVRGQRPGFWDQEGATKYDFWARHKGLTREQAIEGYIKTVAMLE
mmetsp:Transcript_140361/g.448609  ORF Transcript_140361/g.448609 Transcript_140361/m.448609 type:complete len:258 (+) Transcript_140361:3113-3886(+)